MLAGTSAYFGPPERWIERAALVRAEGLAEVAAGAMERWFTADFGDWVRWRDALAATPREGYAACCDALAVWDFRAELPRSPRRRSSSSAPRTRRRRPADAEAIAERDSRRTLVVVPHAAHLLNVEQPEAFTGAVLDHLA